MSAAAIVSDPAQKAFAAVQQPSRAPARWWGNGSSRKERHMNHEIKMDVHPLREKQDRNGDSRLWKWGAAAGAALAATAFVNSKRARRAEEENPPRGRFIEVDGVELHYEEAGSGEPILLLHGNGTTTEDWRASGLFADLAKSHRVVAVDRPGFGYSERPRTTVWTPATQAALIAKALPQLGLDRPLVVGHSFGTMVAMAFALDHPEKTRGLVLLGGYYFPSARADVLVASQPAVPVIGDVMRYTVSPLIIRATEPMVTKKIFAPAPVPERFAEFPLAMTRRPSQIRAEAAEAGMMVPAAASLSKRYGELKMPVTIVAGSGDRLVDPSDQSIRLHAALPGSRLEIAEGAGHMVHYTARARVAELIRETGTHA